jgi:hypothetical protein
VAALTKQVNEQAAHDRVIRELCDELNATETCFPGTELKLVYKVGSS